MHALIHSTSSAVITLAAGIQNPINGIVPDFSFGGTEFTAWWQKLIAILWAVGILVTIGFMIKGLVAMAGSTSDVGHNPQAHTAGKQQFKSAFFSLVGLAALAIIVGVTLAIGAA
ncbi:hypothetical protein ACMT9Y_15295 [Clavibacter tessellarius]|uniref:hypothetical protein n=1 Tax=Clavibacter tessellarius TaxID=31965 RepID=UPI0039EC2E9F